MVIFVCLPYAQVWTKHMFVLEWTRLGVMLDIGNTFLRLDGEKGAAVLVGAEGWNKLQFQGPASRG